MRLLFLLGLLAVVATIVVGIAIVSAKWVTDWARIKIRNRDKHKAIFVDTREVVDDYLKNKADNSVEISMEELERMCETIPYAGAIVDENDEIDEYEGFKASEINENYSARMKQQKGMIIMEA